ncbi:MAG: transferrin-binding protein-like solute binding protein [Novosphingobium sp.]
MVSETFNTVAATGSATYLAVAPPNAATSETTNLNLTYNAGSQTYTVSTAGRSQTFGPSQIDASQSSAQATVYVINTANSSESLTLTKAGTSGRLTYRYVGGGYWQRAIDGVNSVTGTFDAFVYGVTTQDVSVPRTGSARYAIDVLGARTISGDLAPVSGEGAFNIDFALGTFGLTAKIDSGPQISQVTFTAEGSLSATANSFSGTVRFSDGTYQYVGLLNGKFFGPAADEVGGAWFANQQGPAAFPNVAVGTITGRKDGNVVKSTSFDTVTGYEAYSAPGYRTTKTAGSGPASGTGSFTISYDPVGKYYTVISPGATLTVKDFGLSTTGDLRNTLASSGVYVHIGNGLKYVRSFDWAKILNGPYTVDSGLFGYATPNAAVPRAGRGGYAIEINGVWPDQQQQIFGQGGLTVDFASGAIVITGAGSTSVPGGSTRSIGLAGTGALSSSANSFGGSLVFDTYGVGDVSGVFTGQFFGPSAQEIGATYAATGSAGTFAGSLMGKRDDTLLSGTKPLAQYTESAQLAGNIGRLEVTRKNGTIALVHQEASSGTPDMLTWNPATGRYDVKWWPSGTSVPELEIAFGAGQASLAESSAVFDGYRFSQGDDTFRARVYKVGNSELPLTYSSFVEVLRNNAGDDLAANMDDNDRVYFVAFGSATAPGLMPRNGTAVYNGKLYGEGARVTTTSKEFYDLTGTSQLNVDFRDSSISAQLTINGVSTASGATTAFGNFDFAGRFTGSQFAIDQQGGIIGGKLLTGQFYGPGAEEVAGTFYAGINNGIFDSTSLSGAFVAKK